MHRTCVWPHSYERRSTVPLEAPSGSGPVSQVEKVGQREVELCRGAQLPSGDLNPGS